MILIVLNYALLATTFLCNKALVCCIPPLLLTGISSTAAGILLLAWLKLKALPIVVPDKQDLPLLIPAALAASSGAMLLRLYALTTLESFQLSFFSALDPCITAGLCFVLYAERLTKQQAIGIVLASLGSIPMLSAMGFTNTMFSLAGLPMLAAFFSVTVNRLGSVIIARQLKLKPLDPFSFNALMLTIGGILSLLLSLVLESRPLTFSYRQALPLLYVIIVNYGICSTAYTFFLKRYKVTLLSMAELLTPFFVALYGWLFFHKSVSWHFFVSLGIIGAGLAVYNHKTFLAPEY